MSKCTCPPYLHYDGCPNVVKALKLIEEVEEATRDHKEHIRREKGEKAVDEAWERNR